jgi:hypothetical protein
MTKQEIFEVYGEFYDMLHNDGAKPENIETIAATLTLAFAQNPVYPLDSFDNRTEMGPIPGYPLSDL